MLFYGIFGSINLCFLIKRVFIFLNLSQLKNLNILEVGCGGGLLAENLVRLGADVLGVDAT
jgi:2-polyprenyl-6-hydroxyphenyl methylase/3-demethylubiquinone-9 3-methyltransferase